MTIATMLTEHVCRLNDVWPTGHPLPPTVLAKREGPPIGSLCVVTSKYRPGLIVRVIDDSYVWSPGECRHRGGYRRYDWSVVDDEHGYRVVMDDKDLTPITPGMTFAMPSNEEAE